MLIERWPVTVAIYKENLPAAGIEALSERGAFGHQRNLERRSRFFLATSSRLTHGHPGTSRWFDEFLMKPEKTESSKPPAHPALLDQLAWPWGANQADMWKQIYAWFDEFLQPVKAEGNNQSDMRREAVTGHRNFGMVRRRERITQRHNYIERSRCP